MEALAPEHLYILKLKIGIEAGDTVRSLTERYIKEHPHSFSKELARWIYLLDQDLATNDRISECKSFYQRIIFQLIESAYEGEPVYERIVELEKELHLACKDQLKKFMTRLNILSLIPLVAFMFPAFLILLLGPIIKDLLISLEGI